MGAMQVGSHAGGRSGRLCVDFGGSVIKASVQRAGRIEPPIFVDVIEGSELEVAEDLVWRTLQAYPCNVDSVCVAVPGVVDFNNHAMISAHEKYSSLQGVNLKNWFAKKWDVPFAVENDARAALLGEVSSGVAPGFQNAVGIIFGTGIGTAAIIDGLLLRGHSGHGGILGGHTTVDIHSGDCPCGNRGCAEFLASTWMLSDSPEFRHSLYATGGIRALIDGVRGGDAGAIELLDFFVTVWGSTIVGLCHLFDPEAVIVTGGPMRSADIIYPLLSAYVRDHLWSSLAPPQLLVPEEPDLSVLRGLAALAVDSLIGVDS